MQEQVPTGVSESTSSGDASTDQSGKLLAEITTEKQKLEVALEEQILQTLSLQKELDMFKVNFYCNINKLFAQIWEFTSMTILGCSTFINCLSFMNLINFVKKILEN
jgi:hypothetical protein